MSNRVVRQFIEEKKFPNTAFLRLHVGDEDGRRIFDMSSSLEERIKQAILTGITINGRRYSFLAYSSSQLKESSVWMVAPEGDVTVDKMRRRMGDFSGCKTPSKYAARIGQCFSTTFQSLGGCDAPTHSNSPLRNESPLRHVEVDDISSIYENVPHSDGNGLICDETMVKLLRSMPNLSTKDRGNISVIQIRYGGAKGILVAWPSIIVHKVAPPPIWTSMSHHTHDVVLRKSMIKFDAPYRFLEICRYFYFATCLRNLMRINTFFFIFHQSGFKSPLLLESECNTVACDTWCQRQCLSFIAS